MNLPISIKIEKMLTLGAACTAAEIECKILIIILMKRNNNFNYINDNMHWRGKSSKQYVHRIAAGWLTEQTIQTSQLLHWGQKLCMQQLLYACIHINMYLRLLILERCFWCIYSCKNTMMLHINKSSIYFGRKWKCDVNHAYAVL